RGEVKVARDRLVTLRATFRADKLRARNLRRSHGDAAERVAGNGGRRGDQHGERQRGAEKPGPPRGPAGHRFGRGAVLVGVAVKGAHADWWLGLGVLVLAKLAAAGARSLPVSCPLVAGFCSLAHRKVPGWGA